MNKLFFLIIVFLLFIKISLSQEKRAVSYSKYTKINFIELKKGQGKNILPELENLNLRNSESSVYRTEIGKSANAYSFLRSERKPVFYKGVNNYDGYNFLSIVFNADPQSYPQAVGPGSLMNFFSQRFFNNDEFLIFETNILVNNNHYLRYPSSEFFVPENAQNIEDFYFTVSASDSINGSFGQSAILSTQLENINYQETIFNWQKDIDEITSGISLSGTTANLSGISFDTLGGYGYDQTLKHYQGTKENPEDAYIWNINEISPDWLTDPENGHALALYKTWSAWSNDGEIGYMWIVGVTEESYEYGVYQPQIYYTSDGGENWTYIPLNLEDHYSLIDYLPPCEDENGNALSVRPSFLNADQQYPGVVDHMGHLNLFANVYGSATGDVLNPSEANWELDSALGGHLFAFIINEDGIDEILFIDEIKTKVSTNAFGNLSFDHRLQASKSHEEVMTACIWLDDNISGADSLVSPDIFAWDNCSFWGPYGPEKLTENTLYEGFYFYPFLADEMEFAWDIWGVEFMVTTSVSVYEYVENDPTQPITHYFVNSLKLPLIPYCLEGISENAIQDKAIFVSQNDPNPFHDQTKIKVECHLTNAEKISLEIYSMDGLRVYQKDEGYIFTNKELTVINNNFCSGVYFYKVRVGEYAITKKMIIL